MSLPRDNALTQVWIATLNCEKDNLPKNFGVSSYYFEDDCFDSSWMLQSSLTYPEKLIERHLRTVPVPANIPPKANERIKHLGKKGKRKIVNAERFDRFLGFKVKY